MKHTFKTRVTIPVKTVEVIDLGHGCTSKATRTIGQEEIEVAVIVDVQAIAEQLAERSKRSKGKRASAAHGAIVVRPL